MGSDKEMADVEVNLDEARKSKVSEFERSVQKSERRKLKSRAEGKVPPWFGLGMFGLVGWSVVLPMLAGIAAGSWIDRRWPSRISWTMALMFAGLFIGCANAWHWIQRESNDG